MNKKFVLGILFAILMGFLAGNFFYRDYKRTNNLDREYNSYILQLGVFDSPDSFKDLVKNIDYMSIEKNNKYYVYVGISTKKDNIEKLKKVFSSNNVETSIKKTIIDNVEFMSTLEQYDILLDNASSDNDLLKVNEVILSSYEEIVLNS